MHIYLSIYIYIHIDKHICINLGVMLRECMCTSISMSLQYVMHPTPLIA